MRAKDGETLVFMGIVKDSPDRITFRFNLILKDGKSEFRDLELTFDGVSTLGKPVTREKT